VFWAASEVMAPTEFQQGWPTTHLCAPQATDAHPRPLPVATPRGSSAAPARARPPACIERARKNTALARAYPLPQRVVAVKEREDARHLRRAHTATTCAPNVTAFPTTPWWWGWGHSGGSGRPLPLFVCRPSGAGGVLREAMLVGRVGEWAAAPVRAYHGERLEDDEAEGQRRHAVLHVPHEHEPAGFSALR
jgi:hypothetical protein